MVARHQRLIRVLDNALHCALGCLEENTVDLLLEGLLLDLHDDIADRHVGGRHAEGDTVKLTGEGGDNQGDGLSGTSGGGDDVKSSGASAAEVAVSGVEEALVARVRVSGSHHSADDAELIVENLHEGGHAVGGTGSVGHDVVLVVGVILLVDTHDKGANAFTLAWGSNEDLLRAGLNVLARALKVNEDTGGLDNDVDVHGLPRELEGVAVGDNLDFLTINGNSILTGNDISVKGAEDGVVLEKMAGGLDAGGVVNGNDLHVGVCAAGPAANEVTADATEAVDGDADLHGRGGGDCGRGEEGGEEGLVGIRVAAKSGTRLGSLQTGGAVELLHARELGEAGAALWEADIREAELELVVGMHGNTDRGEIKRSAKKWCRLGERTLQTEDLVVVRTAATGATKAIVRG